MNDDKTEPSSIELIKLREFYKVVQNLANVIALIYPNDKDNSEMFEKLRELVYLVDKGNKRKG